MIFFPIICQIGDGMLAKGGWRCPRILWMRGTGQP
jgi:hypothetical protein